MKSLAVFFTLLIIGIVILADLDRIPPFVRGLYDFPNGDKVGHFILFGLLNFFLTLAFARALPNRTLRPAQDDDSSRVALSVGLILAAAIAAEEFSQQYFSARTFDLIDLLASYLGIIVGGWMALKKK